MRLFFFAVTILLFINSSISCAYDSYIIKIKNIKNKTTEIALTQEYEAEPCFPDFFNIDNKLLNKSSTKNNKFINELKKYYIVNIPNNNNSQILSELSANPNIQSISPNYIYHVNNFETNDPRSNEQWNISQVRADKAWTKATGKGIIIGLIDTGIDWEHLDLINNLAVNDAEDINSTGRFEPWPSNEDINGISGDLNGIDEDQNGYIDDVIGYDFVDQTTANFGDFSVPDPIPDDEGDHGTLVAGIMTAEINNEIGIAGIAYDAKIITAKAFDATGNGETDDIARAIVYAALNGAKVLNFSFGDNYMSPIMRDAVALAYSLGCVMVSSAGNSNMQIEHFPSDFPEVICVAGSDKEGERYGYSNYGAAIDLTAPGRNVLTTQRDNNYKYVDGTSIAAPHVSAAAAMLLELRPDLTPAEVRGVLQATAQDGGDRKWDIYFGAGILDIEKALEYPGKPLVEIVFPENRAVINKDIGRVSIIGSVAEPLMNNWTIKIGKGLSPEEWIWESSVMDESIIADTLGRIDVSELKDTLYTVALTVNLRNYSTLEKRIELNIIDDIADISSDVRYINIIKGDRPGVLAYSTSKLPCQMTININNEGEQVLEIDDYKSYSKYHAVFIDNASFPDNARAKIILDYGNSLIYQKDTTISKNDITFPNTKIVEQNYSLPRAYLLNKTAKFYSDKPAVAFNDMRNLGIGTTYVYEFDNQEFVLRDSSVAGWIPVGYGDSNGDGKIEIYGTASFESKLFQDGGDGSIFSETLDYQLYWGAGMDDLDYDGISERVGYFTNGSFFVIDYDGSDYVKTATALLPDSIAHRGLTRANAIGDFNGNGKKDIAFANSSGNLIIYEYSNNSLNPLYIDAKRRSDGNQYMADIDVDGDGTDEILHAYYGSRELFGEDGKSTMIWTVRLLDFNGSDFVEAWKQYFYGVRSGIVQKLNISYKNGISAGNIDNNSGDEALISLFPNMYIFKWDENIKTMKAIWNYPQAFANEALIYDFNDNGINEFGFATYSDTKFFEIDVDFSGPDAPAFLEGYALGPDEAILNWPASDNAEQYHIYQLIRNNGQINTLKIAETEANSVIISGLENNNFYEYALIAYNSQLPEQHSNWTNSVEIFTHNRISPINAKNQGDKNVLIEFSGKLPDEPILASTFQFNSPDYKAITTLKLNNNTLSLGLNEPLVTGDYDINIGVFKDYYGTPSNSADLTFNYIEPAKQEELYLKKMEIYSQTLIKLFFSEDVDTSAIDIDNYELSPQGEVIFAEIMPVEENEVMLNLSNTNKLGAKGKNYFITARNIIALSGNLMTNGPGNTLSFVFSEKDTRNSFVYPQPASVGEQEIITFAGLPEYANVEIYTLRGEYITEIIENDGNGGCNWDMTNSDGKKLTPGVYLYKVISFDDNGEEIEWTMEKFVLVP